jgi:hypothetical protein
VANRLAVIHELTQASQWHYVTSPENPADMSSRGMDLCDFLKEKKWLNGPSFLWISEEGWKVPYNIPQCDIVLETKKTRVVVANETHPMEKLLSHYSTWDRLKKAVACLIGVKEYLRQKAKNKHTATHVPYVHYDLEQLSQAERAILKYVQESMLGYELSQLRKGKKLSVKRSNLTKLDPVIDRELLRVGGRLKRARVSEETRHPVIVPKESGVVKILVEEAHRKVGHMGRNCVITKLRERYWIPRASTLVKSVISKCVICRKYRSSVMSQRMSDLPEERLIPGDPPFKRTILYLYLFKGAGVF